MNDAVLQELKRVVERAVRPVVATMARKRRMREELLAHLTAIFEEESEKLGNEQAALDQAKRRFGNPRQLAGQLQETVSRWDRFVRLGDVGQRCPGESLWRFAGRITMLGIMMFVPATLFLLPVMYMCGGQNELAMRAYCVVCLCILNILLALGVILLTDGMYRALYRGQSGRDWRLATIYALASLMFFPLLAFLWYLSLTGDLVTSLAYLRSACLFAPLTPMLFALLARQAAESLRHYEEWASLKVDE
jgi:hypothetical protein